ISFVFNFFGLGGVVGFVFRFLFKVFCLLILLKFFYCFIQRFLGF
ncbi:hypothetical protein HMPREF1396_01543, partial [Helicobacter pylori GAM114Ai]